MTACKLIEVYQDVIDYKDNGEDNLKYIVPIGDLPSASRLGEVIMTDLYQEVVDGEDGYKNDNHIYESLYEVSNGSGGKLNILKQQSLIDKNIEDTNSTKNVGTKKIEYSAKETKRRVPLNDRSNWTLSPTCGDDYFNDAEKCIIASEPHNKNSKNVKKKNDKNNNSSLFSKLKNKRTQDQFQVQHIPSNQSSKKSSINTHESANHAATTKIEKTSPWQLSRYSNFLSQNRQSKKNLEEDNPNPNLITSSEVGIEKLYEKGKDKKLKDSMIMSYQDTFIYIFVKQNTQKLFNSSFKKKMVNG